MTGNIKDIQIKIDTGKEILEITFNKPISSDRKVDIKQFLADLEGKDGIVVYRYPKDGHRKDSLIAGVPGD